MAVPSVLPANFFAVSKHPKLSPLEDIEDPSRCKTVRTQPKNTLIFTNPVQLFVQGMNPSRGKRFSLFQLFEFGSCRAPVCRTGHWFCVGPEQIPHQGINQSHRGAPRPAPGSAPDRLSRSLERVSRDEGDSDSR